MIVYKGIEGMKNFQCRSKSVWTVITTQRTIIETVKYCKLRSSQCPNKMYYATALKFGNVDISAKWQRNVGFSWIYPSQILLCLREAATFVKAFTAFKLSILHGFASGSNCQTGITLPVVEVIQITSEYICFQNTVSNRKCSYRCFE